MKCKGVYGFQGDVNRVALKVSLHCELPGECIVLSKCSSLIHTSLDVHCSYRLKFFVAKNHPRSSSPFLTAVFLAVVLLNTFNTSFSIGSKFTESVAQHMHFFSLVPGAREKRRSAWYTLFAHAFNLPKMWGVRGIF